MTTSFYIGNLLKAHSDEEYLKILILELLSLCTDRGWRLNQWTSSSRNVLSAVPESKQDASVTSLDLCKEELPVERTLGIHWSMEGDYFTFNISQKERPHTRRDVLSIVVCCNIHAASQDVTTGRVGSSWDGMA
ncbi:uncharacterized protein LOC135218776 [Macrobrachium nipponense]|uniref:uncharacterized protein LOC135218776 n=1 Tax=Macrobrachium nipponense TaxID=159736 RepID=UPI0030C81EEA